MENLSVSVFKENSESDLQVVVVFTAWGKNCMCVMQDVDIPLAVKKFFMDMIVEAVLHAPKEAKE